MLQGLKQLRRQRPRIVLAAGSLLAVLTLANAALLSQWFRYRAETERLRAGMSVAERNRADLVVSSEQNRFSVMLELIRRRAEADREMHLSVSVDSSTMLLERDGAVLRRMAIDIGPEYLVGAAPETVRVVPPLGARSVSRIMSARDDWEMPEWVYTSRGLPPPTQAERRVPGVLGRGALLLTGGAVIYALPDSGVLADSSFVLPGAVRVSREDLRAILPNITLGMSVYFYE